MNNMKVLQRTIIHFENVTQPWIKFYNEEGGRVRRGRGLKKKTYIHKLPPSLSPPSLCENVTYSACIPPFRE